MTAPFKEMSADEAAGFMRTKESQRIRRVIAERCEGGFVLDIGCGRGIQVKELYPDWDMYFGIDCSPELIELAERDNPDHNFEVLDVRLEKEYTYKRRDFAVLKSVLEHQESIADAKHIYDLALQAADTVLVAWHTPPIYPRTEIITVNACDLDRPLYQNHYKEGSFEREDVSVQVERVEGFTLWTAVYH